MEYCSKHGIPHSHFLGWPPDDQDKAIAGLLYERERCPRCGTVPSDWLDEDGRHAEPPPYTAEAIYCGGCEALHDARHEVPDDRQPFVHTYLMPHKEPDRGGKSGS